MILVLLFCFPDPDPQFSMDGCVPLLRHSRFTHFVDAVDNTEYMLRKNWITICKIKQFQNWPSIRSQLLQNYFSPTKI